MKQKSQNHTWKLALLAASLLSSGAVQAFPGPLDLPPPASPDITVEAASILFTPGTTGTTVSTPGTLSITKTGTTGFFLDNVALPSTSTYSYNLVVKTDPNSNNALLSGSTLQLLDTTLNITLLEGNITAFGVAGSGDTAAFDFLLGVTQSLYNYGPRAAIVLLSFNLDPGLSDTATFIGTGNVDNYSMPEPTSLALFAAGGMVLFAGKRRYRLESMI